MPFSRGSSLYLSLQGSNQYLMHLLHCRQIIYHWATKKDQEKDKKLRARKPWKHERAQSILKELLVLPSLDQLTYKLEETLESPLDCKEIQPVHPKGDQSWVFIGRTDDEAETPILWPPNAKSWLIWKDPDAGRDWGLEEKGTTENEMAGWHHQLNGHGFVWTLGVGDGQGGLACCDSWGCKELDTTEWLNWTELNLQVTCRSVSQ